MNVNTRLGLICAVMMPCGLASTVSAAPLSISTDASIGSPPNILPGEISGSFTFNIVNAVDTDAPDDLLTGWQVTLDIVPLAGATGTVEIFDVSTPSAGYLLEGAGFGIGANRNGENLTIFDFILFAPPVQVPAAPGAPLFDYRLEASADALGDFGIYAVASLSEWADNSSPIVLAREFEGLPFDSGPVLIGQVTVVPTPSTAAVVGLAGVMASRRRR
ncbi:MAG: hypothetical protein AAGI30_04410 [Planctomycetota bacterium]